MSSGSKHVSELRLNFVASCVTGSSAVALFNPLDCLRVRWQTLPEATVASNSLLGFGRKVVAAEGLWRGLWAPGLFANTLGIGCSTGLRLGLYPAIRDTLAAAGAADDDGKAAGKTASSMVGAGLLAGALGYWISTPLHLVKTRQQAELGMLRATVGEGGGAGGAAVLARGPRAGLPPVFARRSPGGVGASLARVVRDEGALALWRGSLALAARGALISAGQFVGYDLTKTYAKQHGLLGGGEGPLLHTVAGVISAVSAATLAAPADMLMTRFSTAAALRSGGAYRGYLHCAASLTREEGAAVWLRGWWPMFVRMAPTFVIAMPLYEQLRRLLGLAYMD